MIKADTHKKEDIRYPEILQFILEEGPEAVHDLDPHRLDAEIDWFLRNKRIFILRNPKGEIIAMTTGMIVKDPQDLVDDFWTAEDVDGLYLFVYWVIVRKDARHRNILRYLVARFWSFFPHLKWILFYRNKRPGVYLIKDFIKGRRELNGQHEHKSTSATTASAHAA